MGNEFWSTGIILSWCGGEKWWAKARFEKGKSCHDDSLSLVLSTKYAKPLAEAIDTLMSEAEALGLTWAENGTIKTPSLYISDDENPYAPDAWRDTLQEQARRIGWSTYA